MSDQPIKVFTWAISPDRNYFEKSCSRLVNSAKKHGIEVHPMGVGETYYGFKQKLTTMRDAISSMDRDSIVLCVDGTDVLFNDPLDVIHQKFLAMNTDLVMAADVSFAWQWAEFKQPFEDLYSHSIYRYVNAGVTLGKVGRILEMIDYCMSHPREQNTDCDQGLMGIWASYNISNPSIVRLDSNCDIVWVASEDRHTLGEVLDLGGEIVNPVTHARPSIMHITCLGLPIVEQIYDRCYNKIMSS